LNIEYGILNGNKERRGCEFTVLYQNDSDMKLDEEILSTLKFIE